MHAYAIMSVIIITVSLSIVCVEFEKSNLFLLVLQKLTSINYAVIKILVK